MPFIYIIYSEKLDKYYTGACIHLERRLYEHNIGHSKFTSLGLPWILKYTETFSTLPLAKKRESEIKNKKSRLYIEKLIGSSIG
jgi:putative endonuclease